MSGGAGGIIIIQNIATSPGVPMDIKRELLAIADKNPIKVSFKDKLRVCRIVWQLLSR